MTDLETFKAMLDRAGVDYSTECDGDLRTTVRLETNTANVVGYFGYETHFTFNREGALLNVGVWEG